MRDQNSVSASFLHRSSWLILLFTVVLFSILLSSCNKTNVDNAKATDDAATQPLPQVTVATVKSGEIVARTHVSGTLVARREVLINPQISGYQIRSLEVDVGDRVSKGEVLAQLDKSTLQAQLTQADADVLRAKAAAGQAKAQIASARANANQASITLNRNQRLSGTGAIPKATLDESQGNAEVTQAAVQSAEQGLAVATAQLSQSQALRDIAALNLERATIKAPLAGTISARNATLGEIASSSGTALFKLIANNEVELEAEVIETNLAKIKPGNRAEISVSGLGQRNGTIRLVSPTIDPQTRLGMIRIHFEDNNGLRVGGFADGWIITAEKEALQVPVSAIQSSDKGDSVMRVKDGVLQKQAVQAGLLNGDMREIIAGLNAGDTVLAKAGSFFQSGDKVKVKVEPINTEKAAAPEATSKTSSKITAKTEKAAP